jgi:hypothetical protein
MTIHTNFPGAILVIVQTALLIRSMILTLRFVDGDIPKVHHLFIISFPAMLVVSKYLKVNTI